MKLRREFSIGLMTLMAATAAHAQVSEGALQASAGVGNGSKRVVRAGAEFVYDSNVAASDKATAQRRGLVQGEAIYRPTVSVDFVQPLGRQVVFLQGTGGYDHHDQNGQLDAARANVLLGVAKPFGTCRVAVTGEYDRRQSDLADLLGAAVTNISETEGVSVAGGCGRANGLTESVSATAQRINNSAAQLAASESETASLTATVGYTRPSLGTLQIFGTYADTRFPNSGAFGALQMSDGFQSTAGGANLEHKFGAKIKAKAAVGYTSVKSDGNTVPDFHGITYQGELGYVASTRLRMSLSFQRSVQPANRPGSTYNVGRRILLSSQYQFSPRTSILLGVSQNDSQYETFLTRGAPATPVDDRIRTAYATLQLAFGKHLKVALDARHQERTTPLAGLTYDSNRAGLTITGSY